MRRAGLKLFYSRGFSPKPRFRNAGALPVGLSTLSEPFLVELETAPEDPSSVPALLSAFLPAGFDVVSFEPSPGYDLPVPPTMTYRLVSDTTKDESNLSDADLLRQAALRFPSEPLPDVMDGRDRLLRTSEEVTDLRMDGNDLLLSARVNPAGNTVSVFALLAGATGLSLDLLRQREVVKLP